MGETCAPVKTIHTNSIVRTVQKKPTKAAELSDFWFSVNPFILERILRNDILPSESERRNTSPWKFTDKNKWFELFHWLNFDDSKIQSGVEGSITIYLIRFCQIDLTLSSNMCRGGCGTKSIFEGVEPLFGTKEKTSLEGTPEERLHAQEG